MTALLAEHDRTAAFFLWWRLGTGGQLEVLRALGAQARNAVAEAGGYGWELDFGVLQAAMSLEGLGAAADAAMALLHNRDLPVPYAADRAAAALTLAHLTIGCWLRTGRSAELIAHHCREAAAPL